MTKRANLREALRYSTLGLEFVAAFAAGAVVGMYIDSKTGGSLWTLVGAGAGFAAGLYHVIRMARQYQREVDGKDRR